MASIKNGLHWYDTAGNTISAHGGGFLQKGEYFYWFGENRHGDKLISCYRSVDLVNWEFCSDVVTQHTHPELNPSNCERPKVIYNEQTGKYVMWLHWENGYHYGEARCAVLVSDTVDGAYSYLRSFRPEGHMSRDCTLFQDDDGTAYFISAANENADLHVYRLTDDYLDIACLEQILWPGQKREAPCVFKRGDYYFLITSGCTGWHPNQSKYAYAESITGQWSPLFDLGSPTTFDTQPTYILPIRGSKETVYLYISDRWDPVDYHNSTYVFLPLEFRDATTVELKWASELEIDVKTGEYAAIVNKLDPPRYRICSAVRCLTSGESQSLKSKVTGRNLSYKDENQLWLVENIDGDIIRLQHYVSGRYLEPENGSLDAGAAVVLADREDHLKQEWIKLDEGKGFVKLQNRHSGLVLALHQNGREHVLIQADLNPRGGGQWNPRSFLLAEVYA